MKAYKFAAYPSNSSVASGVTMLVSLWFLVAAGAILTDASPIPAAAPTPVAIAPQAHFTITVEARRSANL